MQSDEDLWCYAAVPPSRYFPRFNPVQSLPVCPGIVPGSQKYICSPIITVYYGLPRSTHVNTGLINQDHPGGYLVNPGGHPVHPGQHTVDTRFIPVNTWFITVHYGSLQCLTVHYGNSDHPGQHQVHYGSSRSTPVSSRSTPGLNFLPGFDAGLTELSNMSIF